MFFTPVIAAVLWVEYLTLQIPSAYPILEKQLDEESNQIETLILGSSQIMSAVNAEWLGSPTLNMASGSQHHDTDFHLLKGLLPRLPKLKTVVLEVSYSHFELPHNGPEFYKNSLYLKYYNVNCFDRFTYFKDRLIYLSNPKVYSERLEDYYIDDKAPFNFNRYGFNFSDTYGQFVKVDFDIEKIEAMPNFKINQIPNLLLFKENSDYFLEMLEFLKDNDLNVVICTVPMYYTYLDKRIPEILERRNSVLVKVSQNYTNVMILNAEETGATYSVMNFWNQSHLSPSGARLFTAQLNSVLNTIP